MSTPAQPTSLASPALRYLQDVEALQGEMQSAMLAISGNRISVLEESLWRQQVLCTSLKHLSQSLVAGPVETSLRNRICEANRALEQVNRSYAVLVQQSSQSTDLLLRLCRSYAEAAIPAHASAPQPLSWSCEA